MKVLVTGGAGFVGSHVSEYYAQKGEDVTVFDNLSRARLLGYDAARAASNWNYLKRYDNIELMKGDICQAEMIKEAARDVDAIIHTAAQTAVTTSLTDPRTDFEVNAIGTFNVLEAARLSKSRPCVVFCSTNKVYGDTPPSPSNPTRVPRSQSSERNKIPGWAIQMGQLRVPKSAISEYGNQL